MRKNVFFYCTLYMITLCLIMTGCNKNEPEQPAKVQTYHVSIQAGKGDANQQNGPRKALGLSGNTLTASWAPGEQVSVRNVTKSTDLTGFLVAQSNGVQTTISGDLTGTINAGDELLLRFLSPDYTNQEGTLAYIELHSDYAEATIHVKSVTWGSITFQESIADFHNRQAIAKFTLMNEARDAVLAASDLKVEVDNRLFNIHVDPAASEIFVALPGFSDKTIKLTATVGKDTYTFTSPTNGVTFEDGKYYTITVGMTKQEQVVHGFTIGENKQVEFAHGNLQYNKAATSTPKWRIAEHQYDYVGDNNAYLTFGGTYNLDNRHSVGNVYDNGVKCNNETEELDINQESWIDLLSWSCVNNTDPTNMSINRAEYISGGFKDWGDYEIYDPVNKSTYDPGTWRTLSITEWQHIFCYRPNYDSLFTTASIDGLPYGNVKGVILLPDDFEMPSELSSFELKRAHDIFSHTDGTNYFSYADNPAYGFNWPNPSEQLEDPAHESDADLMYNKNHLTLGQWELLEEAGAVFLPAAGIRYRYCAPFSDFELDIVRYTSLQANYWSSTRNEPADTYDAYYLGLNHDSKTYTIVSDKTMLPYCGLSVRLVRDLQ